MKALAPRCTALVAGLLLACGAALAQTYPSKPVNLMVPYPAGGPSDAIARIFFNPLGKELGQQVLVENLGGVSGALAAQKVLAAPADGYFVFQGSSSRDIVVFAVVIVLAPPLVLWALTLLIGWGSDRRRRSRTCRRR